MPCPAHIFADKGSKRIIVIDKAIERNPECDDGMNEVLAQGTGVVEHRG
jgi:hypothetical protein